MYTVSFTYSKVTPESAEYGDCSDGGFLHEGREYSMNDPKICADFLANPGDYETTYKADEIEDIIDDASRLGIDIDAAGVAMGGNFYGEGAGDIDYRTGETTTYMVHIK
jgi:hypothetical protein